MDRYKEMTEALEGLLGDLAILSGDRLGPSDVSWQDVAGTAMSNARWLASEIEDARERGSFVTFPSPFDWFESESRRFISIEREEES